MKTALKVPIEKLRYVCDPNNFKFGITSEVEPARGFIGQSRAIQSIIFGLESDHREYNIFITGHAGKGKKTSVLHELLEEYARGKTEASGLALSDICYIYNFESPEQPMCVSLKQGQGREFRDGMEGVLEKVKLGIPNIFAPLRNKIVADLEHDRNVLRSSLMKGAEKDGLSLSFETEGPSVAPLKRGDKYDKLPQEEKKVLREKQEKFEALAQKAMAKMHGLNMAAEELLDNFFKRLAAKFLDETLADYYARYVDSRDSAKITKYLDGLKKHISDNLDFFLRAGVEPSQSMNPLQVMQTQDEAETIALPFVVNLFVDNFGNDLPPIVFENSPSFDQLFFRLNGKSIIGGGYYIDHTCLRSGSLALTNGGYLVLNAMDILQNGGFAVWEKLKKTLRKGDLEMEEPFNILGIASLNPEPMPIKLKVIVVGSSDLYRLIARIDPDFLAVFKVKAEFDSKMDLTQEGLDDYARFISACCQKDRLLPFERSGAAKVVEYGARLAGSQKHLSAKLDEISDLITESSYWADKSRSSVVRAQHVRKALEEKRARSGLAERKTHEFINDGLFLVDLKGSKVGRVNGLFVDDLGDYSFGSPTRITARTFAGNNGLVSIQKEVKTAGVIHNTGVLTLEGYFRGKYAKYSPISFSSSISFEQCYQGMEGDSASVAELISLISSLSDLEVNQGIAVTGSLNQDGEVQPIGGANEKIEGFFDVCKSLGLTGEQGVVIPEQNVQNLMLREDVLEAVKAGQFSIYAAKDIDDYIAVLMGKPEDIDQKVRKRLRELSAATKAPSKS